MQAVRSSPAVDHRRPNRAHSLAAIPPTFWISAVLATMVAGVCAIHSVEWLNRPFPGFFLWSNRFVPAMADTDWSGYESRVPFLSRVVAMDGAPVASAAQVYERAAAAPVGTVVAYRFETEAGQPVDVAVPTMILSLPEYLWTLGTFLAIGSLLTLLGFVVYVLRPDAPAAQAMLASGLTWGLYFITTADIVGPGLFRPLCLALQAISPVTVVHLALTFPSVQPLIVRRGWILPSLYAMALVPAMFGNWAFDHDLGWLSQFNRAHAMTCGLGGVLVIATLAQGLIFPPSPAARQRTKIAALGGFAAFLLPVFGIALFAFLELQFPLNFLALPLALFPIAIGYAVVRDDLFEVDAILRRTVAWAILTSLLALFYLGGVGTLELLFARGGGRVVQLIFLITVIAVFNPLRDRVQRGVDFLFARDRYDYRHTLRAASQALAALLDVDTIVARIVGTIREAMHVDLIGVWLLDAAVYRRHALAGDPSESPLPLHLDPDGAFVERLRQEPRAFVAGESSPAAMVLADMAATLVVPMTFERQLTGFLVLGDKGSGQFYSSDDIGLLQTLANQGAVAIQNARSYEALRETNDELRAAQAKLIEAERLAAIGELSAAVAHGIRNPLAGIKAAAQFARMDLPKDHPLQESIDDIVGESNKLEARIKTLLDFSKPFEPRPVSCDLRRIVHSAVTSLASQMSQKGVAVHEELDPHLPALWIDAAQIEEVLLALVSNAAEAMAAGGNVWIRARLQDDKSRVRLEVADDGPGIPLDRRDKIFRLFFTTKSSGTGFGLAVVKKVVERHGGSIRVESEGESERGARFVIELPLATVAPNGEAATAAGRA